MSSSSSSSIPKKTFSWLKFFMSCSIPEEMAQTYTEVFNDNHMKSDMLADLDKEILQDLGIVSMGHIIRILKRAKALIEYQEKQRAKARRSQQPEASDTQQQQQDQQQDQQHQHEEHQPAQHMHHHQQHQQHHQALPSAQHGMVQAQYPVYGGVPVTYAPHQQYVQEQQQQPQSYVQPHGQYDPSQAQMLHAQQQHALRCRMPITMSCSKCPHLVSKSLQQGRGSVGAQMDAVDSDKQLHTGRLAPQTKKNGSSKNNNARHKNSKKRNSGGAAAGATGGSGGGAKSIFNRLSK
ncbi:hypothetical protein PTSG_01522 [Salpingoeca rosetta]|uniref:SAM domain-containing protein n=1 Tax=Salpingoeca rosetta (strain ATCC 50818 / BSB-021) TaxID=946362 RepID=F2U0L1_SALR5|nr:uncharacterized protein PTSG_01522 [Salpingoeca rosetta]EGD80939.1 hypothetical protein PTSG_01522 [Salpingoeca rosetta]|eukprot:XP_004997500.1 hypothetical protein PTSG_01522 [Salpingoeca rosetta]